MSPTDTPSQRLRQIAARNAASAYQTAAWRTPAAERFDGRPANDVLSRMDLAAQPVVVDEEFPRWMVIAIGAVAAALLGALLGGMMAV